MLFRSEALTEIEKTVALERAGEHLAALHIVSAGLGRHRMDQMRVMFGTSLVAAAQRQRMAGVSIDDSLPGFPQRAEIDGFGKRADHLLDVHAGTGRDQMLKQHALLQRGQRVG